MNHDPHPELRPKRSTHDTGTQRLSAEQAANARRKPGKQQSAKKGSSMSKREKITVTVLLVIAFLLLIAVVITAISVFGGGEDDGRILRNVYAAGVDLGGMTEEEAKNALKAATSSTYTMLDMTIQVLNTTVTLSPADTGARLDINGVVQEAMNYGRTGRRAARRRSAR